MIRHPLVHHQRMALAMTLSSFLVMLAPITHAEASTFVVDSTTDAVDAAPGDHLCASADGACTLCAAVQEASALGGSVTIVVPAGTYLLTIPGSGEDEGKTGDLDVQVGCVADAVSIIGAGAATTIIDGNDLDWVIDKHGPGALTIVDLTIEHGSFGGIRSTLGVSVQDSVVQDNGGRGVLGDYGVLVANSSVRRNADGGIFSTTVGGLVTDSIVEDNQTQGLGGGILAEGDFDRVVRTIVRRNRAHDGGGVYFSRGASIEGSLIADNVADNGGSGVAGVIPPISGSTSTGNTASFGEGRVGVLQCRREQYHQSQHVNG